FWIYFLIFSIIPFWDTLYPLFWQFCDLQFFDFSAFRIKKMEKFQICKIEKSKMKTWKNINIGGNQQHEKFQKSENYIGKLKNRRSAKHRGIKKSKIKNLKN
ncbi:hypothetical protein, partial [Klebsiella pneumoniae]|uniref:hypothetical protein n=1 Tax=Klebsiella pneumoniae TaxID=573 RepID=UPI0013E96FE8